MQNIDKILFRRIARKDERLKDSSFRILNYLIDLSGYDKIFVSKNKIKDECGIKSSTTISNSIKNLRDEKYIEIEYKFHTANTYKLNIESILKSNKIENAKSNSFTSGNKHNGNNFSKKRKEAVPGSQF